MQIGDPQWPLASNDSLGLPTSSIRLHAPALPADTFRIPQRDSSGAGHVPLPVSMINREVISESNVERISWTVPAQKLKTTDNKIVSASFDLRLSSRSSKFKIIVFPNMSSEGKGGCSFKKSKGKGFIQLKCEDELHDADGVLKFRLFAGSEPPRGGPETHDFRQNAVKGLPKEMEVWDFSKCVVDGRFVVGVEIVP